MSGRTIEIVVHPTNEDIVYAGTAQGGLYRSLDGGTTWTNVAGVTQASHTTLPTTLADSGKRRADGRGVFTAD